MMNQKDEQIKQILQDVFLNWDIIEENEDTGEVIRSPKTRKQVEESEKLLNKAKSLNPDDEKLRARLTVLLNAVNFQKKRLYVGKNWVRFGLIAYALILYIIPFFVKPDVSMRSPQDWYKKEIGSAYQKVHYYEKEISNVKRGYRKYSKFSEKEKLDKITELQGKLEPLSKKYNEMTNLTDKEIEELSIEVNKSRKLPQLIVGLVFLMTGLLYKKAHMVPTYLFEKRNERKPVAGLLKNFFYGLYYKMNDILINNQPVGWDVETTFRSGRTENSFVLNPVIAVGLAFKIGIPVSVVAYIFVLSPIIVLNAFLRNYVFYK